MLAGRNSNQQTFETHAFALSEDATAQNVACVYFIKDLRRPKGCGKALIDIHLTEVNSELRLNVEGHTAEAQPLESAQPSANAPHLIKHHNYIQENICGWTVHIHDKIQGQDLQQFRETLCGDLDKIVKLLPGNCMPTLMKKHIYMSLTSTYLNDFGDNEKGRGMCYHMSPEWLSGHGNDPKKAGCIEMYQLSDYIEWRSQQPFMVLHELSHSYHHENDGKLDGPIDAAYQ